ncbi:JmjC domain containing protein [Plasmodium reichenowi]|uniref:JmjC domain containing protein n=1 Tax=Plasmodium reichenowi TaxID=5854 RepID=A0A151LNU8_PLARE|nr:JmjC domain containing protein [Plasmodium reichenowi]KYO00903.1 JmjC domain containing protein [Plasmodium reichenowi]
MSGSKKEEKNFDEYAKSIKLKIKKISKDEIKTARTYEEVIKKYNIKKVPKVSNLSNDNSSDYFYNFYYEKKQPLIISKLQDKIGQCIKIFNSTNIIKHIGDTKVSIHVGNSKFLNNVDKNFRYTLSTLKEFIELISKEDDKKEPFKIHCTKDKIYIKFKKKNKQIKHSDISSYNSNINNDVEKKNENYLCDILKTTLNKKDDYHNEKKDSINNVYNNTHMYFIHNNNKNLYYYYYRSLGVNQFKDVSNIKKMNSFIRDNFFLPQPIYPPYHLFDFFSSILRIGQTNLFIWLHYDIPDNFLIQIKGRKKILLIPPKYIQYFNIIDSSSSYNLFHILTNKKLNTREKSIKKILCKYSYVADLYEGDILFIPSLWLHYVYNMPPHTYMKRKYKQIHQFCYIKKKKQKKKKKKKRKIKLKNKHINETLYERKKYIRIFSYGYSKFKFIGNHQIKKKNKISYIHSKKQIKIYKERNDNNNNDNHHNNHNINNNDNIMINDDELIKHYNHLQNASYYLQSKYNINNIDSNNKIIHNISNGIISKEHNVNKNNHSSNVEKEKYNDSQNNTHIDAKLNISINYFFRKKNEAMIFNKKDLYGNQDINVANQIFKKIQKEIEPLLNMNPKYKNFYIQKIKGLLYANLDEDYI